MTLERPTWEMWDATVHALMETRAEVERLKADAAKWQELASQGVQIEHKLRVEIEWLKAEKAGDQQRLFHYEGEIERLTALLKMTNGGERELSAFLKQEVEIKQLKAAIAWTREVHPGKNAESGGAIVHMTWDQFDAMRALAGPKP